MEYILRDIYNNVAQSGGINIYTKCGGKFLSQAIKRYKAIAISIAVKAISITNASEASAERAKNKKTNATYRKKIPGFERMSYLAILS